MAHVAIVHRDASRHREASEPGRPGHRARDRFQPIRTPRLDAAAAGYVLKPFSDERLFSAVERAKVRVRERRLGELASEMASLSTGLKNADPAPGDYLARLPFPDNERGSSRRATSC